MLLNGRIAGSRLSEAPEKLSPYFGRFGGQFVPEVLMPAVLELEPQPLAKGSISLCPG